MLGVFLCQGGFIMQLRQIITDVGGTFKSIELPNSRSVVMLGDDKVKDSVMSLVKSMLGCDYTGVLSENFDIDTFTSSSSVDRGIYKSFTEETSVDGDGKKIKTLAEGGQVNLSLDGKGGTSGELDNPLQEKFTLTLKIKATPATPATQVTEEAHQ